MAGNACISVAVGSAPVWNVPSSTLMTLPEAAGGSPLAAPAPGAPALPSGAAFDEPPPAPEDPGAADSTSERIEDSELHANRTNSAPPMTAHMTRMFFRVRYDVNAEAGEQRKRLGYRSTWAQRSLPASSAALLREWLIQ